VVQRRSEAAGVASRWTVVKVARGADDAHCRGRLVGFIWRELHHDGERDEAVLLRVLVDIEACGRKGGRTLAQPVCEDELHERAKTPVKPAGEFLLHARKPR